MKDALHILEPPPRKFLVQEVKMLDPKLEKRLEQSRLVAKKADASRTIYKAVMKWHHKFTQGRRLLEAIKLAQEREENQNSYNLEDDMFNYGRAGEAFK
jgi:hypothetical protein